MPDARDIAELAVISIAPEVLERLIGQYLKYRTETTLLYLRSSLAIEARRAIDQRELIDP